MTDTDNTPEVSREQLEVAVDYGLKLVEKMSEQRDAAREGFQRAKQELEFVMAVLSGVLFEIAASEDEPVVIPKTVTPLPVRVVPTEETLKVYIDEEAKTDGEAEVTDLG